MKSNIIKYGLTLSSLLILNSSLIHAENNVTSIDTLFLYSQGAEDNSNGDAETKINHLLTTTNKIYSDSRLNVELNSVKIHKIDLDDTASSYTVLGEVRQDATVQALRDEVGADEVVIYRPYANDGLCGLAYYNNGYQAYAYAHVTIDCAGYVTGHEVGHNMHLAHSAKQDPDEGYNRGHGVQDQFTTVMAYAQAYNGPKIYKFSDPDLDCNGEPCGIEPGLENEADAVREIQVQAPLIANFREHVVIDDTNDTDDNNKPDDNNTNDDLEAAKKAYEDQLLVVQNAKAELKNLRATIKTTRTTANTTFKTERQKLVTTYSTDVSTLKQTLTTELNTLKQQLITARADRTAKKITKDQYRAIVTEIRADRTALRTAYKTEVTEKKTKLKEDIQSLKEASTVAINEAKDAFTTYRTEVYLVEVAKLKELKKIYDDLLNAQ